MVRGLSVAGEVGNVKVGQEETAVVAGAYDGIGC